MFFLTGLKCAISGKRTNNSQVKIRSQRSTVFKAILGSWPAKFASFWNFWEMKILHLNDMKSPEKKPHKIKEIYEMFPSGKYLENCNKNCIHCFKSDWFHASFNDLTEENIKAVGKIDSTFLNFKNCRRRKSQQKTKIVFTKSRVSRKI